jgi:hypothetical protein
MYVAWLTSSDTFHLAGYRIGADGVQGTLFSRTMPGEFVSLADGQVLVRDPGVPSTWSSRPGGSTYDRRLRR